MKLKVQNFQVHKSKTLDIPENATTFLEGDSDIGKSSLFRALRWACENKPDGGSFVTIGSPRGTVSTVELEVEPGLIVTRERGKSKNSYSMNDVKFEAFGRSVPEPIAKALKLSPYAFQGQGDVPFLVGMSPTEAAKILTEACGLGVIDTATQLARAKKTVNDANLRKSEILLGAAQERLTAAQAALPLADALERTAGLGEALEGLAARSNDIERVIDAEPTGNLLNIERLRVAVARAFDARAEVQSGVRSVGEIKSLLGTEPTGVFFYLNGLAEAIEKAKAHIGECKMLSDMVASLRAALFHAPDGQARVLTGIAEALLEARTLREECATVQNRAYDMHAAIRDEPRGVPSKLDGIANSRKRGFDAEVDLIALEKMRYTLQRCLADAPSGMSIDTTELQQQRAQIKVCPTCGRAL